LRCIGEVAQHRRDPGRAQPQQVKPHVLHRQHTRVNLLFDAPAAREQVAQRLALSIEQTQLPLPFGPFLMMLHGLDPDFDAGECAVVDVTTHAVQHAREVFGALEEPVDRRDHIGQQLALRGRHAFHDLENRFPIVAGELHRPDVLAEFVGFRRRQVATHPRAEERCVRISRRRPVDHIAPRIP